MVKLKLSNTSEMGIFSLVLDTSDSSAELVIGERGVVLNVDIFSVLMTGVLGVSALAEVSEWILDISVVIVGVFGVKSDVWMAGSVVTDVTIEKII